MLIRLLHRVLLPVMCLAACGGRDVASTGDEGHGFESGYRPIFSSPQLGSGYSYLRGEKHIQMLWVEVPVPKSEPGGPVGFDVTQDFSSSFPIDLVLARHPNEIYPIGHPESVAGQVVPFLQIERWVLTPPSGAPIVSREAAMTSVGIPVPPAPTLIDFQGGAYVEPDLRPPFPAPFKTVIYSGSDYRGIVAAEIDPEARFIVAITRSPDALVLFPVGGGAPTTLATSSEVPFLSEATDLAVWQHATLGRVYLATGYPDERRLMTSDVDNDGVLEAIKVLTGAQWKALRYPSSEAWLDDYIRYEYPLQSYM